MAEQGNNVVPLKITNRRGPAPPAGPTDGDGGSREMKERVEALEKDLEKIDGKLDGILKLLSDNRVDNERRAGEVNTNFARIDGAVTNLTTITTGLRADLNKLPDKYEVAKIMVFVITGLGAAAAFLKYVWPLIGPHGS